MSKITVNGAPQEVPEALTLAELIVSNNITQPDMVSVQLNGEFVYKEDYGATRISAGDEVDFLYIMGGGQTL
jgi:sulfur carrier protein